jgi:hypothetical protein
MLAGEAVKNPVEDLGVTMEALYRWRRQALIDSGQVDRKGSSRAVQPARSRGRFGADLTLRIPSALDV